jgi:hypothetical protein
MRNKQAERVLRLIRKHQIRTLRDFSNNINRKYEVDVIKEMHCNGIDPIVMIIDWNGYRFVNYNFHWTVYKVEEKNIEYQVADIVFTEDGHPELKVIDEKLFLNFYMILD